ncbi:MAG: amino acid ABC transporter substrate-binding protein [Actinomycetia bacterium]|nr:amino acid ABC transporter substrate-binding protein [Actinomycetes bacterium]
MLKRLAVLFAVLALVAAACGGSDDSSDTTTTTAAEGDSSGQETIDTGESTLATVVARGKLICGVSGSAIGFSVSDDTGNSVGFDADYCRAVAAATLGDATAVEFRDLTAAERFEALKNGEIDVLIRNSTWTQSRDADIGVQFATTTYYDGQQILASTDAFPGLSTESGIADIDGATVCVNAGTTTEKNITEGAQVNGITITLETYEDTAGTQEAYLAGTCDVYTTDGSGLFAFRSAQGQLENADAANWVIFPGAPISKEPLGPVTRQNDDAWFDIVNWTVFATFIADEAGIDSTNVDGMMDDTPELTRLFGGDGELQTAMGLNADAFLQVIKQVGSYGEIFENTLTGPLGLERSGPNLQWFDGGLIYAPPAR